MSEPFPPHGRLAGIDYGTVRIGVAITDPERRLASPYENYVRQDDATDGEWFRTFIADERVVGFVIGLPVRLSGQESDKSQEVRRFGRWLRHITLLPVCFFDERYTSVEAEAILGAAELTGKQKKIRKDMVAAQIMLAAYLESAGGEHPPRSLDD